MTIEAAYALDDDPAGRDEAERWKSYATSAVSAAFTIVPAVWGARAARMAGQSYGQLVVPGKNLTFSLSDGFRSLRLGFNTVRLGAIALGGIYGGTKAYKRGGDSRDILLNAGLSAFTVAIANSRLSGPSVPSLLAS